ncbi:ATP-binding protein [Actinomadura adrarensis]|uniref:ATP-binding protein n=1 Tax=Actinomadura adrarensis TaxID=1819600 RepID=A0ABW3CU69_9ACTN
MTRLAEARPPGLTYRLILTADVTTIRVARKLAEVALTNWNLCHLHLAVTTVVSELATNASKEASGSEIEIALFLRDGWLRLEVWDRLDVIPEVPAELDLDAEGGRGLWVAEHRADKFGIDPHPDTGGKTVWTMWMCGGSETTDVPA